MKLKLFLTTTILTLNISVQANNINTYKGQVFEAENISKCIARYHDITDSLDSLEGFLLLEGECFKFSDSRSQIRFKYIAPSTRTIERFQNDFKTKQECSEKIASIKETLTSFGNIFIDSYCKGNQATLDYIDLKNSMFRSLYFGIKFNNKNRCDRFLVKTKQELEQINLKVIYERCGKFTSTGERETVYLPSLYYLGDYKTQLHIITGRVVPSRNHCAAGIDDHGETPQTPAIKRVSVFCEKPHKENSNIREHLIYTQSNYLQKLNKYSSILKDSKEACENHLISLKQKFEALKYKNVYSFCEKVKNEKYKGLLYYIR